MNFYQLSLACLLVSFIDLTRTLGIGQSVQVARQIPLAGHYPEKFIFAPELFHDSSCAVATVKKDNTESSLQAKVFVDIIGKKESSNVMCYINLTPETNVTDVEVSSLRRASDKKVLLTTREKFADSEYKSSLIWLDLKDCTYSFAYGNFLPDTHFVIPSHNLVSRNKFRVFVANRSFCKGSAWCTFLLPSEDNNVDSSNIEFPWEGTHIESIEDLNVDFYAYHYYDKQATYKMILGPAQPPKYTKAELLTLKSTNYTEVMSSQLSVCYTMKESYSKTVNCSKFNNYGRLMFNKTVNFPEPISLLYVKNTKDGLLLFTSKTKCAKESCSDIFVSKISENDKALQVNYRTSKLNCAGDMKNIVFDAREENVNSIKIEYVCSDGEYYNFNDLILTYT